MRIAFVTPSLRLGGYEKVVIAYANELARRGNIVDILCGKKCGSLVDELEPQVQVVDFNARARNFIGPLIRYLRINHIDLLYSGFREYNCICILAKKIAKSEVCIYATQHGFQGWNRGIRLIEKNILKKADCLIAVADEVATYEAKYIGVKKEKIYIFNNPVLDSRKKIKEEFHPWFKENIPIIGVSGRLAEGKGISWDLKILEEIKKTKTARMMILGDGPLKNELERQAGIMNISDNVEFLGFVNNPMGYLQHCAVFLHAAIAEGFGNVIVEALYMNLPVCVTNCSGPLQIIENDKYGINIGNINDPDFVKNAAKKIIDVLDGNIKFEGLQERALCFEVQKSTDQFMEPYYEYIKKNKEKNNSSHC